MLLRFVVFFGFVQFFCSPHLVLLRRGAELCTLYMKHVTILLLSVFYHCLQLLLDTLPLGKFQFPAQSSETKYLSVCGELALLKRNGSGRGMAVGVAGREKKACCEKEKMPTCLSVLFFKPNSV